MKSWFCGLFLLAAISGHAAYSYSTLTTDELNKIAAEFLRRGDVLGELETIANNAKLTADMLKPKTGVKICSKIFGRLGYQGPEQKIGALLVALPLIQQDFLKKTLVDGLDVNSAILKQYIEQNRNRGANISENRIAKLIPLPDFLPAEASPIYNGAAILDDVDSVLKEQSQLSGVPAPTFEVIFGKVELQESQIKFNFKILHSNQSIQILQSEWESLDGQQVDDFLSNLIVAVVNHRNLLDREDRFRQEVHMLAYNLKKLLRVGNSSTQAQAQTWLSRLIEVKDGDFSSNPSLRVTALLRYLEVKKEVLVSSQKAQEQLKTNEVLTRDGLATQPAPSKPLVKTKFTAAPNNRFSRSIPGRLPMRNNNGYYSPIYRQSNSSNSISTIAFMLDPYYMLTHPWYWGLRADSFLTPFMMMGVLEDMSTRSAASGAFQPSNAYDPRVFDRPVDPIYYQNEQRPVGDPWDAPLRNDTIYPRNADSKLPGSWERADGKEFVVNTTTLDANWSEFVGDNRQAWGDPATQGPNNLELDSKESGWSESELDKIENEEINTSAFEEGDGGASAEDDGTAS